jgi:hypothetical protein
VAVHLPTQLKVLAAVHLLDVADAGGVEFT